MQIYKIVNKINNKLYIGKDESNSSRYMGSGKLIKRAIIKYGLDNFTKEVIEECSDSETLQEREKFWIEKYKSQNPEIGYNISPGGDGGDTISNNPDRESIIKKITDKMKGRIFTEDHKNKLKENHNSKNPEVAKKISQKLKGRIFSEEHKERLRQANLGKKRSPESIDKNRIVMRNSKWIHNNLTGEEKRVPISSSVESGWSLGRCSNIGSLTSLRQKGKKFKYYRNPEGTKQRRVSSDQKPPKDWVEGRAFKTKTTPTVKIGQYDSEGTLIRTFLGYRAAEEATGVRATNITNCCLGNQKTAGGYAWKKL